MGFFLLSVVILVAGYFIYGKVVENVFGVQEQRLTPAHELKDGVDYVPMPWYKIFLIQFLNIAGLGPIYGAIAGALWGPKAFIWIVLGSIFAGGVHDYFSGMLSIRNNGASVSEIVGKYLGTSAKQFMRIFSVVLLILVGTVFMTGPARLLGSLNFAGIESYQVWLGIILVYYFLATILPVDKIIGKVYPLFGAALLVMAVGIGTMLIVKGYQLPALTMDNIHPSNLPIWPLLFITIACGAISGFHATQSPLMARCVENERYGRKIFYGSMIAEGIIALIWAAAAMSFYQGTEGLFIANDAGGPGAVVYEISTALLGGFGGLLAMLGVIACPITSGDTAFRSARLVVADFLKSNQSKVNKRLMLAVPLFIIGFSLSLIDFNIVWRYFAWSNQTLATFMLWASAMYLAQNLKFHWIATIPATFMTAVVTTYILQAPEGFELSTSISYPVGIVTALVIFLLFLFKIKKIDHNVPSETQA
ncbi:carbon starvation CstA family protein [Alkaliphilus transvaalensis]|uniref:carbon starvation CstA family protein n=1 Tax=Alkaliphilus transvaalensis TaxID=114628 RepID=UPI00047E3CB3|nr:carbon starvation protein A [Alkaliphilus transvaalensis]